MHRSITRIAIPAILLGCAGLEVLVGGDALPTWLANLSAKSGLGPDRMLRLILATQLAGAALALAYPRLATPIAWATGAGLAFSGLAELSAIVNAPGDTVVPLRIWAAPLAGLAVGASLLAAMSRPHEREPWRRPGAWQAIGVATAIGTATAVAARLPIAVRSAGAIGIDGVQTVTLDPKAWIGMNAPQAGIARHLPLLTPLTMDGTKWVVFYSADCGRCHQVFEAYFAGPQHGSVIAVEVPPPPGAERLDGEDHGDIVCEGCERLSLPDGTRWAITTPTIVRFTDGVVDCATSVNYSECRRGSGELP